MHIRPASPDDIPALLVFFDFMCGELGKQAFLPKGNRGGFPSRELVERSVATDELILGEEDGRVMAAYILNAEAGPAYDTAPWRVDAQPGQALVLHALRVHPDFSGHGYAKALVTDAIQRAHARGAKAIRLDCIEGNDVPHAMYRSLGFADIGTADITYEDIGEPRTFLLFERPV